MLVHQSMTICGGAYAPKHDSLCCGAYAPKHDSTLRWLPPKRYELRCGVTTKALRIMLRCLHTNALRICCGLYTKALRNSYGGVYCISTEVLRPEVSVIAPKDAEVVTITEAGLLRSP